ncbi:MAG: transglutaminase domain-containing protein [Candidatus Thermoplasmatota archaeon]|nr:transglutaminase domain-containing protein [Candidatus Thermoplasmatota archaeon]
MSKSINASPAARDSSLKHQKMRALSLVSIMIFASLSALEFGAWEAMAQNDQDGDGLTYGLEFLLNTQPGDWDSDGDGLPDGWEYQYGLDPLDASLLGQDGATGDPDGDGLTNLQEYSYLEPASWDLPGTPNTLDNGVWWHGTVPVRNWDEESAMQAVQGLGSDGVDEDPLGNMCADGIDNDKDGLVDAADPDNDGDADCSSDDDDGDGDIDEDRDGWDTDNDGMSDGWEVAQGLNATNPSNDDGMNGDPDNDGLINIYEYINPSWTTSTVSGVGGIDYFQPGPNSPKTETQDCNPVQGIGPGGGLSCTANVDNVFSTNPNAADTDGDGLNDSYEALTLLTDPTDRDTDQDGIEDGVEVAGTYGNPAQASDPRNNNTDGDELDDGDEDKNGNGFIDPGTNETDPTRSEDAGDFDNDGIENWEENLTCTRWDLFDTDFGGVGDGDERNWSHGTDPCDSLIDYSSAYTNYNAGLNRLTLADGSGFNPNGGTGYYNDSSGQHTSFAYSQRQGNNLFGVALAPPASTTEVVSKNGSFCHYSATQDGTITTTNRHCDDDFEDSDGDGLADWQELEGTFGFTSLPSQVDSDGDFVSDYDEVMNGTDPMEPCDNNRDSDFDLLNDYFENTTVCLVDWIPGIIGNGSIDTYVTNYLNPDTDAGGVWDGQEYLDGTNPQDNPNDDQFPSDFDGDGIPDSVENITGTDWRDPDTDGGGMSDGAECPPPMWMFDCIGGQFDPWDPTDDIIENDIIFYANNTTLDADSTLERWWRLETYDLYTGASYGKNESAQIWTPVGAGFQDDQWVANSTFINTTQDWEITFLNPVMNQHIPHPYATTSIMGWIDPSANMSHGNITHDLLAEDGSIVAMFLSAPDIWYEDPELSNSIPYAGPTNYALEVEPEFLDSTHFFSEVRNITFAVINEAACAPTCSAWDKAVALQDYLRNGNGSASSTYLLNHDGSALPFGEDSTSHLILAAKEGRCSEFNTAFTTMSRIAGLPTRKVSGFKGGVWHGSGYAVYGNNLATWSEVHLQQNAGGGNFDMGWMPLDPCPDAAEVQVINEEWSPLTAHRNHSTGDYTLNGTLEYVDNGTAVDNHSVKFYLVPPSEVIGPNANPTGAALNERLLGDVMTNSTGEFELRGMPAEVLSPGYATMILEVSQRGYVSYGFETFTFTINITDDLNITQDSPAIPGEPIVGAGTTTVVSGFARWENMPFHDPSELGTLSLIMNFTTVTAGSVSLQTTIGTNGYYEFNVTLDENEPTGVLLPATIDFPGWHEDGLHLLASPVYHGLPGTYNLDLNISASPNLTATLEGPGLNNSLLSVDENLYINGTVLSRGLNPVPMTGTLYLQMRQNGSTGPMENLTSWVINASSWSTSPGNFSLVWNFTTAFAHGLDPGFIDVELLFVPDLLEANDIANLTLDYGLQSTLTIEYVIGLTPRGQLKDFGVSLTDHRGNYVLPANGTYESSFLGSLVSTNTSEDAAAGGFMIEWTPNANTPVGDYLWYLNYTSSTQWYKDANSFTDVRITGQLVISTVLSSDWVHIGNTTYITGDIRDDVTNALILDNQTNLIFQFELPGVGPNDPMGNPPPPVLIDIGSAVVNTTTGLYNFSFTMPTNFPAGVYNIVIGADLSAGVSPPGPYYALDIPGQTQIGCESEAELILNQSFAIVEVNQDLVLEVDVKDIAAFHSIPPAGLEDGQNISGAAVEFFWDAQGTNTSLGTSIANPDGRATLTWTVPMMQDPGYYDVWVVMADDVTDPLGANNARWIGNHTLANVTVQVTSSVNIDAIVPSTVTAGVNFQLVGNITDSVDPNRNFSGPVSIEAFWLDDPTELMTPTPNGQVTTTNGSFNFTVNSDPDGDGVVSGTHTLVVSVVVDSNPFYLTATGTKDILVMGVTDFDPKYPFIGQVVNRGESVEFGGTLKEVSDDTVTPGGRLINLTSVGAKFHDTWMTEDSTNLTGEVGFNYTIPTSHPLGLITITLYYNGSGTLLPVADTITTVTVRSYTVLVIDPITENPVAGGGFNVTGSLVSDNGSAIIARDGTPLLPTLTFEIDGFTNTFSVSNGVAQGNTLPNGPNGTWTAFITLNTDFANGTHEIIAEYTPGGINFYEGNTSNNTFDSRGYSVLTITSPIDLNLDDRTIRGDTIDVSISLIDNAGNPIGLEDVVINSPSGMFLPATITTDASGLGSVTVTVDNQTAVGPHWINASYAGLLGTTGIVGDDHATRVIILAPTNLTINTIEGTQIAGQTLLINGTLLDEHGNPLLGGDGTPAGGVVHLWLDGSDVGSTWAAISNGSTGEFSIIYTLPQAITAGHHDIAVEFLGGYLWVDPVGSGDSVNPEYYLNSSAQGAFNATQPTYIVAVGGGEVDREDLITVSGGLYDSVDRPISDMTISIYLDGVFLTDVTTDSNGEFEVFYPIPSDMTLGPVTMDIDFVGAPNYLSSNDQLDWTVFSHVVIDVFPIETTAIGDTVEISGTVRDNLPNGWIAGHEVTIFVDGGPIVMNLTTDENGVWSYNWTVPMTASLGPHVIEVTSPEVSSPSDGWYRSGYGNGSISIAHHTAISFTLSNNGAATRGAYWAVSGRLYDSDQVGLPGVPGAVVEIELDGVSYSTEVTDSNGTFSLNIPVDMSSTRGDHTVSARYAGSELLLESEGETTVVTWSDVTIEIISVADNSIRGDANHPIRISGRIVEFGGSGNTLSEMPLVLVGPGGLVINDVNWDNATGGFEFVFTANRDLSPGDLEFILTSNADNARYFNTANTTIDLFLRVRATFDVDFSEVEWGGYSINGTITVRDFYSSEAIAGLSIEAHLRNDTGSEVVPQIGGDTNENGVYEFSFDIPDSHPNGPFSNQETWGWLHLWFNCTRPELADDSRADLTKTMYSLEYEPESKASDSMPGWVWGIVLLAIAGAGAGLWMIYMRRKEAIDQLAEIFSYTAELLAAGDEIREAIFHCYEDMCDVLMARGLLRRDFETVREFEMAIRKAMPISEDSLTALDNMFEVARYSRHELDDTHRQLAVNALQRTLQEIEGFSQNAPVPEA